jgi:general secretion pathway protein J
MRPCASPVPRMTRRPSGGMGPAGMSPAGTTLIELLVALSLLALIAVLLLGGMRLGLRVWDSGGDRQAFEQRVERTDAFLRQLLGQAGRAAPEVTIAGANESGATPQPIVRAGFQGEADRLHFIALLPYQLGSDGKYEFELVRHSSADGGNLVLGWRRNIGSAGEADQPTQTVLLGDVRYLHFAYFGHLTNEAGSAWHDRWADPTGLPALIRLDMSLALGQEAIRLTFFYAVRFSNNGV